LLADGAEVLLDWSDIVLALGLTPAARRAVPTRPAPDADGRRVLDALGGEAASPEQLAARTGLPPEGVAMAVVALERGRWVRRERGWVWPT
jgi:predicted Rossmann fold nucleotide-binding protein DprA/Smf involved in DNA uptake